MTKISSRNMMSCTKNKLNFNTLWHQTLWLKTQTQQHHNLGNIESSLTISKELMKSKRMQSSEKEISNWENNNSWKEIERKRKDCGLCSKIMFAEWKFCKIERKWESKGWWLSLKRSIKSVKCKSTSRNGRILMEKNHTEKI